MLSEYEQKIVWDSLLGAQISSAYFAALSHRYQVTQRNLTLGTLILSSGAFLSLVTSSVPANYAWVKPVLALLAAVLSAWSLLAKNERKSIDTADLHFRWNLLSMDYQRIWGNIHADEVGARLSEAQEREALLSKSSTAFPDDASLMARCQENIVMHHEPELAGQGVA